MTAVVDSQTCGPTAVASLDLEAAATVAEMLKAVADPLRLRMLAAISNDPRGECCVCDLVELAEVSQPTVSHHLKVLKQAGLLTSERRGTWVYYGLDPARREAVTLLLGDLTSTLTASSATRLIDRTEP